MEENIYIGAFDPRTDDEKELDYKVEEVASGAALVWNQLVPSTVRSGPNKDQAQSGSCVAMTGATITSIENIREENRMIDFSASDFYGRRVNKHVGNGLGMTADDISRMMTLTGTTLEMFMPSWQLTDAQMTDTIRKRSDAEIGLIFSHGPYFGLPKNDIDAIASYMEQYRQNNIAKPVMLWFDFDMSEWTEIPERKVDNPANRHSVTALEYGMYQGQKAILVQESFYKQTALMMKFRIITESYLKTNCNFARMWMDKDNDWRETSVVQAGPKPVHVFNSDLHYSAVVTHVDDVKALQTILAYEKLFNADNITGYYGQLTAKAVLAFQQKYQVDTPEELAALAGKTVGPKTRTKLNELYSV